MKGLKPGDRLGDWVVDRPLGEGGMGSVYRCHSALADDVRAAVKVLTDSTSAELRARFVEEMRTLAALSHPGIVRVLGGGIDEARDLLFMAMELVEGESLEERLARGALPADAACALFASLADALAHAHHAGIAHRDIKPGNIMIRASGDAVLVDFGIAFSSDRAKLTREGMLPGTLAYLPPEAFLGELPDPKSTDAYAWGVTFYEALTGADAFPVTQAGSEGQRLAQITGQKMRAEALDPGEVAPASAREVVIGTTAPEPSDRLRDLGTARDRLGGVDGSSGATSSASTWSVPVEPPRRRRSVLTLLFGLGAAGVIALLALVALASTGLAVGLAWHFFVSPPEVEPRAIAPLDETVRAGAAALDDDDLTEAWRLAGSALDSHPEEPSANLLYGSVLLARGDLRLGRVYLCGALDDGIGADASRSVQELDCARGPEASTPLTSPLAMARRDLSEALADLDADLDAAAAVEESAPDGVRERAPTSREPASSPPAKRAAPEPASSPPAKRAAPRPAREPAPAAAPRDVEPAPQDRSDEATEAEEAREPSGSAGPAPSTSSPLTKAQVQEVIRRETHRFTTCHERGMRDRPDLEGQVRVSLVIGADGRVQSARVASSTLNHDATDACLVAALTQMQFPRGGAPTRFELPIRLAL